MNKKKLLALLMALVMTLSLMPMTVIAEELETVTPIAEPIERAVESVSFEAANAVESTSIDVNGTATTVYPVSDGFYQDGETYDATTNFYITNLNGLKYFRDWVNGTSAAMNNYYDKGFLTLILASFASNNPMSGKNVHLLSDIDLTGEVWQPIGPNSGSVADKFASNWKAHFYGSFYGYGHKITNMDTSASEQGEKYSSWPQGFFGSIANAGRIDGLVFVNPTVVSKFYFGYAGVVVGDAGSNSWTISNCSVKGNITVTGGYSGGICGIGKVNISNCTVDGTGTISGNSFAGGLVGAERCSATSNMSISNNAVKNVEITSSQLAGGLVGAMASGAAGITTIENNLISCCKVNDAYATEETLIAPNDSANATLTLSNNTIEPQPAAAVAEIGDVKYATLQAAINAAGTSATTVQLIGDISDMETVTVAEGQNITLDLNGHSIATAVKSGSGNDTRHYYAIDNYGTFTLKDTDGAGEIRARGIENLGDGIMTIEGGKIVAIDANGGAAIWNEAALEFKSGTLEATYSGTAVGDAGPGCLNNRGTAHIYSGTFTDASVRCYAICNYGDLTIEDATVSGVHGALTCDYGTLVVNGGSYTARNYYGLWITNDGDITDVTVNGGYFKGGSIGKNAIRASVDDGKQDVSDATIRITGGTFTGDGTSAAAVAMNESNSVHSWGMAISGGTFSTEPDASYIAKGYAAIASGGVWIVKPVVATSNDNAAVVDTKLTNTIDDSKVDNINITSETTNVSGVKLSTDATVDSTNNGTADKSGLQAVVDAAKDGTNTLNSTPAGDAIAEASTIEVTVDVKVTPEIFVENQTATFDLTPTATVVTKDAGGDPTATISGIDVTNDMIDQLQDITVNIYTGFQPVQIIHRDDTGAVIEVFTGNQIGYNTNTGVATVTIHHFSELEATGPVAQIGGTPYNTLESAFAAVQDGETITLLNNVALTERLFVNAGDDPAYAGANNRYATTSINKTITLDMNGHNIQSSSNIALAGGSLNIVNTSDPVAGGTISTSASGLAPIEIRGTGDLTSKRTLTIGSNVTLEGPCYGLNIFGTNEGTTANDIDVTVNGTVKGMLFVLGNLTNAENDIGIVVNGKVDASEATGEEKVHTGIAISGNANVTVNDGATVKGESGIEVRAGSLTVNGGTITATEETYSYEANVSGTTTKGAAIAVAQHNTKLAINATVNDGTTLSGTKQIGVTDVNNNMDDITVTAADGYEVFSKIPDGYLWVEQDNMYTLAKAVARIGETKYASLEEAFAEAADGDTITLLSNCSGNGIIVPQGKFGINGLTVDFGGFTYTVNGETLAGSTGTKTQAFQLLKGNKITFNNGTIIGDNADMKMLIQNYADLTLDKMVLDATQGTNNVGYVLSTNNGNTVINDTTITAKTGGTAFDVDSGWGNYQSNSVEVTGNSVITGNVEVAFEGKTAGTPSVLTLTSGTLNGNIVAGKGFAGTTVTKEIEFNNAVPEGYVWVDNGNGTSTLQKEAKVTFEGGSLRKRRIIGTEDEIVYNETDLRFGFTVYLPKGAVIDNDKSCFTWYKGDDSTNSRTVKMKKVQDIDDVTHVSNLVLNKVTSANFNTDLHCMLKVVYKLNNTEYTIYSANEDPNAASDNYWNTRSVYTVADGLTGDWAAYAEQLLQYVQ